MRKRTIIVTSIIVALVLGASLISASAATKAKKKSVYVCSKISFDCNAEGLNFSGTGSLQYTKTGLIKKMSANAMGGLMSAEYKCTYKKSKLTGGNFATYLMKMKRSSGKTKFKYNKKGYLVRIDTYDKSGKLSGIIKFKLDKKGRVTKGVVYDKDKKVIGTSKYKLDKKGRVLKRQVYDKDGKLTDTGEYKYTKNRCDVTDRDADNKLISTDVRKYKNGRLTSYTLYDETADTDGKAKHSKVVSAKFSYKKVKTTKYTAAKKQQYEMFSFIDMI